MKKVTAELSTYISKFLRDNFGKGPEFVHCSIYSTFITIYIKNFITPPESILISQNKTERMIETRDLVINSLAAEIKANIYHITGMRVNEFYYDWGVHNRSAMFTCICSDEEDGTNDFNKNFPHQDEMEKEIAHLSKVAQKEPEELISYQLNNRTLLFIRNGILVRIEKELIRDGLEEQLKLAKRRLEKRILHNNTHFEEILGTKVIDIFVDWEFNLDKSVLLFITNPTQ